MIVVPSWAWRSAVDALSAPPHRVERVAYFDGVLLEDVGVVTTITVPDAELAADHYRVPTSAMSDAGKHLRRHRLRRLAQLHIHGGGWTGHSPTDDARAYSQADGSVSIVFPDRALCFPGVGDVGVHRRERGRWRQLDPDEIHSLVRIVPSMIDLRA